MNTIFIVLPILTILMFDLGLALKPQDFQLFLHRPLPILAGLLGQIVVLPLLAWAICYFFHVSQLFVIGIMLIACSPFVFNNETIAVPAIIYALMMNIILLIYVFCLGGRRSKV